MTVGEKTYFEMQLDSTIRETEKLLKKLKEVKLDWTERRREDALAKSISAARISEAVALKTRSLPAHTGHPKAEPLIRKAIAESVPVEVGFTEQDWLCIRLPIFCHERRNRPVAISVDFCIRLWRGLLPAERRSVIGIVWWCSDMCMTGTARNGNTGTMTTSN